jgi:hypothetical protein
MVYPNIKFHMPDCNGAICYSCVVSTPALIWEVPGSNISLRLAILTEGFLWISSVPPGKCQDSALN